jgi:hypothetical protein
LALTLRQRLRLAVAAAPVVAVALTTVTLLALTAFTDDHRRDVGPHFVHHLEDVPVAEVALEEPEWRFSLRSGEARIGSAIQQSVDDAA